MARGGKGKKRRNGGAKVERWWLAWGGQELAEAESRVQHGEIEVSIGWLRG
jgi:hypothetical protein